MRQLLGVSSALALAQCLMLTTGPVEAAEGVVLVGCELFVNDGPRVAFVQSHGVSKNDSKFKRGIFVSGSSFRSADFEGRPCAEVLSQVEDDGLQFKAMDVFGRNADVALWFFRED